MPAAAALGPCLGAAGVEAKLQRGTSATPKQATGGSLSTGALRTRRGQKQERKDNGEEKGRGTERFSSIIELWPTCISCRLCLHNWAAMATAETRLQGSDASCAMGRYTAYQQGMGGDDWSCRVGRPGKIP